MDPHTDNNRTLIEAAVLAVVCFISFFVNNDALMPDIMESRNIITAREMVHDGHWIVPTMNGDYRFEKPPLPTWLTAVAEAVCPDNLAMQRGVAGLAALLLVFFFWRFAADILRIEPFIPSLLLVTCYNVVLLGRTASWDIYCHAFMMGGIYFLARAMLSDKKFLHHFIWFGIFTGLSIMSKGPVSPYALLIPFIVAFCIVKRPHMRGKWWALILGVAIALVIGTWWYIYIHIFEADALNAVIRKESGSWINHNVRPWWYYWQFFLESGAWSLLLLTAIFLPAFQRKHRTSQWYISIGWLATSLLLLSLLPEKKTRYLLPIQIPACLLMGSLILQWIADFRHHDAAKADKVLFRINAALLALVVAVVPVAAWIWLLKPGYMSTGAFVALTAVCIALAGWLIAACIRLSPRQMVYAVTALFLYVELFGFPSLVNVINNPDQRSISATHNMDAIKDVQFYHLESEGLRIELVYAASRTIRPIDRNSIPEKLPLVLLTHQPVDSVLSDSLKSQLKITPVGYYDDNRRPRGTKRYSQEFIYHVSLLESCCP